MLAFDPSAAVDAQLFLPETLHVLTMLVGVGPLLVRQTVYGLLINTLRTLASASPSGEMDGGALVDLLGRAQEADMMANFGLGRNMDSPKEAEGQLVHVRELASFLGEVLDAAAVSMGESQIKA